VSEGDAVLIGFDLLEIETGNVFEIVQRFESAPSGKERRTFCVVPVLVSSRLTPFGLDGDPP
jgi:hypothetical protein